MIDDDHVVVRLLDPARISQDRLEACRAELLTPDERRRADGFRLPRVAREYVCTRLLQRRTLSELTGVDPADWRFSAGDGGRPEIAGPSGFASLSFSLSHTAGLIACAVGRGCALGVDVEHLDQARDIEQIAARFFAATEVAALKAAAAEDRGLRFLQLWTLKEASLKALGSGLAVPLDAVEIDLRHEARPRLAFAAALGEESQFWQALSDRPGARHVLGLALRKGRRPDLATQIDWSSAR